VKHKGVILENNTTEYQQKENDAIVSALFIKIGNVVCGHFTFFCHRIQMDAHTGYAVNAD
jgi:hypothetical protein